MKKHILSLTIFILLIIFSGCSNSKFNVNYNEKNHTTSILLDDKVYILKDANEIKERYGKLVSIPKKANSSFVSYSSNDEDCKVIQYRVFPDLTAKKAFYLTSVDDDIKRYYKNCSFETINNIKFYKCKGLRIITKDKYGIHGIVQKKYIYIENEKCFNKLKNLLKHK